MAATSDKALRELKELRAALDWYAEMAKLMQRATLHVDSQHMLGLMKQLALPELSRAVGVGLNELLGRWPGDLK